MQSLSVCSNSFRVTLWDMPDMSGHAVFSLSETRGNAGLTTRLKRIHVGIFLKSSDYIVLVFVFVFFCQDD